jgi:outer membrane protein OmpA-like peptidoglycan-associated protein
MHKAILILVAAGLVVPAFGQEAPAITFKSEVVAKSTKSVNYRHRMGSTRVDFKGTAISPSAEGKADVNSKAGRMEISFEMRNLPAANTLGKEYLTYVLWAITPEGRPSNLGELILKNGKSNFDVTTELQAFGLIVTAEPYFAVTMPSDLIVAENEVRQDTLGRIEVIDAKYELLQRGEYSKRGNPMGLVIDPKTPLEIYQARNALEIAKSFRADKYAPDVYAKAQASLRQAEEYQARKDAAAKPAAMMARDSVQRSEDARALAVKRAEEERLEAERAAAAAREAAAKKATAAEAQLRAQAEELQRMSEEERKIEKARRVAAEEERLKAEAARDAEERRRLEAERTTAQLQKDRAELEEAKNRALVQEELARKAAEELRVLAAKAEADKAALRQQLFTQFSLLLETRDTERGLVVNMGDLLFDIGKATLRQDAREKLARLSGLVLAHVGLKLEAEGHTDSTGSDALNQRLSEQRAESVRAYMESMGINPAKLSAMGFGKSNPIGDNSTAKGRQENRRVELIISGEVIGNKLTSTKTADPSRP